MGYMFRPLLSHHQALKIQIRVTMFICCTVGFPMLTKYILWCVLCRNGLYSQWRVGEFRTAIFLWRGELGVRLVKVNIIILPTYLGAFGNTGTIRITDLAL